jgi:chemotaxis protein CheX
MRQGADRSGEVREPQTPNTDGSMTQLPDAVARSEYPFVAQVRSVDRDKLLVQLVSSVWESMLELPILSREEQEDLDNDPRFRPALIGIVRITGAWEGAVAMSCRASFAAECGAMMFRKNPAELDPSEVTDAWGELVNMVGGNLKAMLPPVSQVSLPDVREHPTFSYREPESKVFNELTFACLGKRLRVTVLQKQD